MGAPGTLTGWPEKLSAKRASDRLAPRSEDDIPTENYMDGAGPAITERTTTMSDFTELAETVARIGRHEWPQRLAPAARAFLEAAAETLGIDVDRVSIKAKSPEHLGLLGREEGIAAMAVVTVELP